MSIAKVAANNQGVEQIKDKEETCAMWKKGDVTQGIITDVSKDSISLQLGDRMVKVDADTIKSAKVGQTRQFEVTDVSKDKIVLKEIGAYGEGGKNRILISASTVSNATAFTDNMQTSAKKAKEEEESASQVENAKRELNSNADRITSEDVKNMQQEGMLFEKYNLERLSKVIDTIKENRDFFRKNMENQKESIELEREQIEGVSEGLVREIIARRLRSADLPDTKGNIDKVCQALDMSLSIPKLNTSAMAYIVENDISLNIEEFYKASYSAAGTGTMQAVDFTDFEELMPQIKSAIDEAGYEVNSEQINNAKWLLDNGLPVNKDTISKTNNINEIMALYTPDKMLDGILDSMNHNVPAVKTPLMSIMAGMVFDNMNALSNNEGLRQVADKMMGIRQQLLESMYGEELESIQIDDMKADDIVQITMDTVWKVKDNTEILAMVQAGTIRAAKTITFGEFSNHIDEYEKMSTKPRQDMGDTIGKAFEGIEDLLKEMDIPATKTNIATTKMLAYANIEITKENINSMKEYAAMVENTFNALKPAVVVSMVKDGVNPLNMTFDELHKMAADIADTIGENEDIKYSEYLYRLDKNKELSAEERDAYIGIYRLIKAVEKTDGAAVALNAKTGKELTMANLLETIRTYKGHGIDAAVDDDFGSLDGYVSIGKKIDEQILSATQIDAARQEAVAGDYQYEQNLIHEVGDNIGTILEFTGENELRNVVNENVEMLTKDNNPEGKNIDDASDNISNSSLDSERIIKQLDLMREIASGDGKEIVFLNNAGMEITLENLFAVRQYIAGYPDMKKLNRVSVSKEDIISAINTDGLVEETQDDEGVAARQSDGMLALDELFETYSEEVISHLDDLSQNAVSANELRQILNAKDSIRFLGKLASRRCYEMPVKDDEGNITNVNLTFISGKDTPKVSITLDRSAYGKVIADFDMTDKEIKGLILSESVKSVDTLKEEFGELNTFLQDAMGKKVTINYARMQTYGERDLSQMTDNGADSVKTRMDTSDLCRIAGKVIEFLVK